MHVLVTGGTGFIGREILRELDAAGHSIRLLVRKADSPTVQEIVRLYQAEVREGNVLDTTSLAHAMPGADAIIHLVGIITEFGDQTFENVHVRATQNMVHAALVAGVRRFVHMSALGTRPNAESRYHQTKWAAECIVNESTLDWTIFRPSIIYGRQDQFLNTFVRMSEWSPVLPLLGRRQAAFQPIAVQDVAQCFVRALEEPRAYRQTFDLCGPDRLTLAEMIRKVLTVTGRKCWLMHVDDDIATVLARVLEFVYPRLLRKPPPLTRDQLRMLKEDNAGEVTWPLDLFQLKPVPFSEGILRYLPPAGPAVKPRSRTP